MSVTCYVDIATYLMCFSELIDFIQKDVGNLIKITGIFSEKVLYLGKNSGMNYCMYGHSS